MEALIKDLTNINYDDVIINKKNDQLNKLYNKLDEDKINEYNSKIYKDINPENLNPKLQFVENQEEEELFDYLKTITSSYPLGNVPGRVVKILVYDSNINKYIGLIQLSVDLLINKEKSNYFGIDDKDYNRYKKILRDSGANISTCVPLQPFGFNFCGGKLLAMLAFSKEVYEYYNKKFGIKLKYLITLSINGKSVQYARLKQLKFIGYTLGYGITHLTDELLVLMKSYINKINRKRNSNRMSNHTIVNNVIKHLKLDPKILEHKQKKGIYIGMLGSKDFIKNNNEWQPNLIEDIETIYKIWIDKYAIKRKTHLINTNRFLN